MRYFAMFLLFSLTLGAQERPNIILIMVDDMGYSDIGCYGSEIKTPALDRMAAEGLRFRQFYNNAKCMTTRASIVSGIYPQRDGHSIHLLRNDMFTIADAMNKAGYNTIMSGKWHLGSKVGERPIDRGFSEYYGLIDGCSNFFNPVQPDPKFKGGRVRVFGHNDKLITQFPEDYYTTDAFTDHALQHIKKSLDEKKPYFLHLTYTAPHYPLHAKPEDIAKYKGRYKDGWEKLNAERYARQLELGVIDKSVKPAAADPRVKSYASRPHKDWEEKRMEVYAAMVDSVDQNIARILKLLDETKSADNTLIMFISDNGACAETPGGDNPKQIPGPKEFYSHCGPGWAWAQNTPFRRYKSNMHEGGICTPCVVRWPRVIKANSWTDSVAHIIDLQPTFMKLAGLDPVKDVPLDKRQFDGEVMDSIFRGQPYKRAKPLFFEYQGTRAVRDGDWKACYERKSGWRLYNIAEDRTELKNLSAKHPERLKEMAAAWDAWAAKTGLGKKLKKSNKGKKKKSK